MTDTAAPRTPMPEGTLPENPMAEGVAPVDESPDALAAEVLGEPVVEEAYAALQAEVANWKDKAFRAAAEADNTRKRAAADVADAKQYAVTSFARDMLAVADNLERALTAAAEADPLREGVKMVAGQLAQAMEKHGISRIETIPGSAPNPDLHQAMLEVDGDAGMIVAELQAGYTLNGRLLRAALVSVGKRS